MAEKDDDGRDSGRMVFSCSLNADSKENPVKSLVVPKFSSFKPPPKAAAAPQITSSGFKERPINVDNGHEKRPRKDDSDRKPHRHRHRSGSPSSRHRNKRRRTESPAPPPKPLPETDLYKLDTKGDPANVTYGTSYRYSVPSFHRFGAGYVLGLPPMWRIDREKGEGKGIVVGIRGYDNDKRPRRGNMFAVDASRVGRLKSVEGVTTGFGPEDEFVPVSAKVEDA